MDRRQMKTRRAIYGAFRTLLERHRYDKITVQDIIDEADVGRSTFYAHFETKEMLLDAMCSDIFYHAFESDPCPFAEQDGDLLGRLTHTLFHVREEREDLSAILRSESAEVFLGYFKKHLEKVFSRHTDLFADDVPREFLLHHLSSGFADTVKYWAARDFCEEPERIAEYFMRVHGI